MRLLNVSTYRLEDFDDSRCAPEDDDERPEVPYVILSHRWVGQEVQYHDMTAFKSRSQDPSWEKAESAKKIVGACKAVRKWRKSHHRDDIGHIWIDACCIDQTNLAELSRSINSMHRWYRRASVCFAYLFDYDHASGELFTHSKWFTRGWTLQELVSPSQLEFFDRGWIAFGSRADSTLALAHRTLIGPAILSGETDVARPSVAGRLSWYGNRTTAVPEDMAYCLMGLFDVHMPLLYGEGAGNAFLRLQEEIIKYSDDHSIFVWLDKAAPPDAQSGLLAPSPRYFDEGGVFPYPPAGRNSKPFFMTNKGLSIELPLQPLEAPDLFAASLDCLVDKDHYLGIFLKCLSAETQQYCRVRLSGICAVPRHACGDPRSIFVKRFSK